MTFGKFDVLCNNTMLPLCSVVGSLNTTSIFEKGIVPECYPRPVELANTMIFNLGAAFIHFGAIIVVLIIIFNVRNKYTAIGRSELLHFFYIYLALTISSLVVDCGVTPPGSGSYPWFVALQLGLISALCISLLFNGFVCFQFWEDGLTRSMWSLRVISFVWGIITFVVAMATFNAWGSALDDRRTTALFVVAYVINAIILAVYVVSQLVLVFFALDSWWHLGAIVLFCFFFVAGQVIMYVFNNQICLGTKHYVDGVFFATACNLFAVMMIYKFWDMITLDDLEFSVANVEQGVTAFGEQEKRYSTLF